MEGERTALEIEAAYITVRHMRRSAKTVGKRMVLFIDCTAGLGALAKGRFNSKYLNRLSRKLTSGLLLADIRVIFHWVPTDLNSADEPSRARHFASRSRKR